MLTATKYQSSPLRFMIEKFISQSNSLKLLRISVAIVFLSHSIGRIVNSTTEIFGVFLTSNGKGLGLKNTEVGLRQIYDAAFVSRPILDIMPSEFL